MLEQAVTRRESVPYRVVDADGRVTELSYSSPRPEGDHDEAEVVERLPWFEPGKPLKNWLLHETDFYDEVDEIWGRPWGAEGTGTLREVLVSRPTENGCGPSTRASGSTTAPPRQATRTSAGCARSSTSSTSCSRGRACG